MRTFSALVFSLSSLGCGASLTLRSSAFADGGHVPARHTADGQDISPPLRWSVPPSGAVELVLVCHDPDAPRPGGWVHWVVYGVAPTLRGLPEGVEATARPPELGGGVQGKNDFDRLGYGGPSPPPGHGPHHYRFTLYALDRATRLQPGAAMAQLMRAIRGHVIAQATLTGIYERPHE